MDRDSLSGMKVSELRQMCKQNGLLVSGNKDELIGRLLGEAPAPTTVAPASKPSKSTAPVHSGGERDDAIDRLIARVEAGGGGEPDSEPAAVIADIPEPAEVWWADTVEADVALEAEVIEADIVEAEFEDEPEDEPEDEIILESESELPPESITLEEKTAALVLDEEDDPWTGGVLSEEEPALIAAEVEAEQESEASITITLPSLSSIEFTPKVIGAITISALILGAIGFTLFVKEDSSFEPRKLHYGDSMQFDIGTSSITIQGDDMVAIFRNAAGGALDDACGELTAEITSGTGSISIRKGDSSEIIHPSDKQYSGAVTALDAYGRSHLAAEKILTHTMNIDLDGKTWRNPDECGNTGWILEDNNVDMTTKTWTDIGDKQLIRTNTDMTIRDIDNRATNLEATTFGLDAISGLGVATSFVLMPLTPIDLHEMFTETSLTSGATSEEGSDWTWSVGDEINDAVHGLVYPITMSHEEFDTCNGHIRVDLLVKSSVPWPVQQDASIVVDKSQKSSECGLVESSLSDAAIPDGRITIVFSMRATSSNAGERAIDWLVDYTSKPGPGEDRPGTSAQRDWGVAMPDESNTRAWDLEAALECTMANYSSSGVATAIEAGGYVWKASTVVIDSVIQWNMSWVTEDERAGWTNVKERDGGCVMVEDESMDDGTVQWNRNAIPETLTMQALESRLLSNSRYPGLNLYINDGNAGWDDEVEYGYRLSVTEENDLFDLVPVSLGEGVVNVGAEKVWTDSSNREHRVSFTMDAENGRMLGWFHFWAPAE